MSRPTKALIDLDALRYNCSLANSLSPCSKTMAIIKADAYGHGALAVAQALNGVVAAFGVASIEEAIELRDGGLKNPIHLLEGTFSDDEVVLASEYGFSLSLANESQKRAILDAELPSPLDVWIDVDTGMHRLGIAPKDLLTTYQELLASHNVTKSIVLATHFSCADDVNNDFTAIQLARMHKAMNGLSVPTSFSNSAGILGWPETGSDWNRLGLMLYGSSPFVSHQHEALTLQPVMTLRSEVIALRSIEAEETVGYAATWKASRQTIIATVAIGYGDGYPFGASNGTPVLIRGRRCPLAGRVSMDMITVDVTDVPSVEMGDEVILWGKGLPVNEIAESSGTISYELLARMPSRTPRVYAENHIR
jgi:alanine racemase